MAAVMVPPQCAGTDLRLLRAAVFSAVCVVVSAAGHAMASGAGIPLWALAVGWTGVLGVTVPLAGRERSLPGIALALLAGELGLHSLFCLGQEYAAGAAANASTPNSVVALAERLLCDGGLPRPAPDEATRIVRQAGIDPASAATVMRNMPGMSKMAGMAPQSGHTMPLGMMFTPAMVAGHLAAALVLGWILRRGEAALWRIVRLSMLVADCLAALLPLAGRALAVVVGLPKRRPYPARPRREPDGSGRPDTAALRHAVIRRGPPAVVLAA
jgi:hypothetical protein